MKYYWKQIFALIFAIVVGLTAVSAKDKPFLRDTFYKGNQKSEIDYKKLYKMYQNGTRSSSQLCDKSPIELGASESPFIPTSSKGQMGYNWFWAIDAGEQKQIVDYISKSDTIVKDLNVVDQYHYLFKVKSGTKIVSPGESYLESASSQPSNMYPEDSLSNGVYMQLYIKDKDNKLAYRITYTSMSRWWCNMRKTAPDELVENDSLKPYYTYDVTFSSSDLFSTGQVVGESGISGIQKVNRNDTDTYIGILVEKSGIDDSGNFNQSWSPITLKEFFK